MYSVEMQMKIQEWRKKAAEGTITLEEMREALAELRSGRLAAATSAKAKSKKQSVDSEALLSELEGL